MLLTIKWHKALCCLCVQLAVLAGQGYGNEKDAPDSLSSVKRHILAILALGKPDPLLTGSLENENELGEKIQSLGKEGARILCRMIIDKEVDFKVCRFLKVFDSATAAPEIAKLLKVRRESALESRYRTVNGIKSAREWIAETCILIKICSFCHESSEVGLELVKMIQGNWEYSDVPDVPLNALARDVCDALENFQLNEHMEEIFREAFRGRKNISRYLVRFALRKFGWENAGDVLGKELLGGNPDITAEILFGLRGCRRREVSDLVTRFVKSHAEDVKFERCLSLARDLIAGERGKKGGESIDDGRKGEVQEGGEEKKGLTGSKSSVEDE